MIANITSGNSFSGVIMYNEKKIHKGQAVRLFSNVLSVKSSSTQLINALELVCSKRQEIDKKTFHVSLAFADGDKLNELELVELGKRYMHDMGYSETPFIIYRHFDTGIDHLHIVASRIDLEGNRISDSMERYRSQRIARKLEHEYGLKIVSSQKNDRKLKAADLRDNVDQQQFIKNTISTVINKVLNEDKATSFEDFSLLLKKNNVIVQLVKINGAGENLISPGVMFSIGKHSDPSTKRVKGSSFHQKYTYRNIINILNSNLLQDTTRPANQRSKQDLKQIAIQLISQIKTMGINSTEQLDSLFRKYDLQPNYIHNSAGIYGLKIKDLTTGIDYKASDLSRDFSWNVISGLLSSNSKLPISDDSLHKDISFQVIVSPDPNDQPIQWVKQLVNKGLVSEPIKVVLANLSRRGFVSQLELDQALLTIGFKAHFSRDFSRDSGGIYSIAFTQVKSGKTYPGSMLDKGNLTWPVISKFVASDSKSSSFDSYVHRTLMNWHTINKQSAFNSIDNLIIYLNQNGITLTKSADINYLSQIDGTIKVPIDPLLSDSIYKSIFSFSNNIISKQVLHGINSVGYFHEPLTPINRDFINAFYNHDFMAIAGLVNSGYRIDISKLTLMDSANEGVAYYKAISTLQQQLSKTIRFAAYVIVNDQTDKLDLSVFIRALNKRGLSVQPVFNNEGIVVDLDYFLTNREDHHFSNQSLPASLRYDKISEIINFSLVTESGTMMNDIVIGSTDRQIQLFRSIEEGNASQERYLIAQGATVSLSDDEISYFGIDPEHQDPDIEEYYSNKNTMMKNIISWIDELAQAAQGECPVSKDESRHRKRKKFNKSIKRRS